MKSVITGILILFIAASVAMIVVRNSKQAPSSASATAEVSERARVVGYYFHRTQRCPTCLRIEELAGEIVKNHFADQLKSGDLKWKIVNIEKEGNEHYETDFNLSVQSIVLVNYAGGKQSGWKNLDLIWEKINDEPEFEHYILAEVDSALVK